MTKADSRFESQDTSGTKRGNDEQRAPPAWLRATPSDAQSVDFESPIRGLSTIDSHSISERFRAAIPLDASTGQPEDNPAGRVFSMLTAVMGMEFKPAQRNEPYGAMATFADGRRSPIPEDFRGTPIETLAHLAERAVNAVLRARLADVCWLLDRKQASLGSLAASSYVEIVQMTDKGEFSLPHEKGGGAVHYETRDHLRRALQIGRSVGWDKPEIVRARDIVKELRARANNVHAGAAIRLFSGLDLDFGISDPADVAAGVTAALQVMRGNLDADSAVELWRLAARAYRAAKNDDGAHRSQAEAAECLVSQSEANRNSAMLASHHLSAAIAQLHGIPGKKDRRTELRHRLIEIQARIPEEMTIFSQEMDLREVAEIVEEGIEKLGLLDKLLVFGDLAQSPDPDQLVKDACKSIQEYPLSSLFGASHHDSEGKVIHRTEGGLIGETENHPAVVQQIAQAESIRRNYVAFGKIDVARRTINQHHYLSDDVFSALIQHSPFVPHDLVATFARGFARFFRGDFVSALYILTPLLENSLRHVLKQHGHDVTIFDDAAQTQQDRTISSLFAQMRCELEAIFTRPIVADIERVFLARPGPYLRHSLAHGLLQDGNPYGPDAIYGCGLIMRLCLVPLFRYRDQLSASFDFG
jgi:hypothetical protein